MSFRLHSVLYQEQITDGRSIIQIADKAERKIKSEGYGIYGLISLALILLALSEQIIRETRDLSRMADRLMKIIQSIRKDDYYSTLRKPYGDTLTIDVKIGTYGSKVFFGDLEQNPMFAIGVANNLLITANRVSGYKFPLKHHHFIHAFSNDMISLINLDRPDSRILH